MSMMERSIEVSTMVSTRTKGPLVTLVVADGQGSVTSLQLEPSAANKVGADLIAAAESATVESLLIRMLTSHLGLPMDRAGGVLSLFREMRERLEGEANG